jgi:hypothetical protein
MLWCSPEMCSGEPKAPIRTWLPRFIGQDMPSKGPSSPVVLRSGLGQVDSTIRARKPFIGEPRGLE